MFAQKVKYFSYEMGAFGDILVDSATDGNLKEALVLKDDNGSVTSEISPIIYSIEGAIRLIEANFKSLKKGTSTARAPFESKYLTYIDRKYFDFLKENWRENWGNLPLGPLGGPPKGKPKGLG